jgi:hypothetical protein
MSRSRTLLTSVGVLLLTSCGPSAWIHPTKSQDEFQMDYNSCELAATRDPKLQQGIKYLLQEATERCLKKKGWALKQKE